MLWGITGCSGSGASSVASVWKELGASVCFLDRVGHEFLEKPAVRNELEKKLGISGLSSMSVSELRVELRERAFTQPEVLREVNRVIHKRLKRWVTFSAEILSEKPGIYVLDAALVFELELENILDFTITVRDSRERSLKRIQNRDGISLEAASGRWLNQIEIGEKCLRSNFVIDNSGSLADLNNIAYVFYKDVIKRMEDAKWHTKQEKS